RARAWLPLARLPRGAAQHHVPAGLLAAARAAVRAVARPVPPLPDPGADEPTRVLRPAGAKRAGAAALLPRFDDRYGAGRTARRPDADGAADGNRRAGRTRVGGRVCGRPG